LEFIFGFFLIEAWTFRIKAEPRQRTSFKRDRRALLWRLPDYLKGSKRDQAWNMDSSFG
jgi:hypothetical protein